MPLQVGTFIRMTQTSPCLNHFCIIKVTNKQPDRVLFRATRSGSILGAGRPCPPWGHPPARQWDCQPGRSVGLTAECYRPGFIALPRSTDSLARWSNSASSSLPLPWGWGVGLQVLTLWSCGWFWGQLTLSSWSELAVPSHSWCGTLLIRNMIQRGLSDRQKTLLSLGKFQGFSAVLLETWAKDQVSFVSYPIIPSK